MGLPAIPPVVFRRLLASEDFRPKKATHAVIRMFEAHQPQPNPTDGACREQQNLSPLEPRLAEDLTKVV